MEWMSHPITMMILMGLVVIQWIALQALLVNYTLFKRALKKPKPDEIRFHMIEKSIAFQAEQIDQIFKKLNELRREVGQVAAPVSRPQSKEMVSSLESSFVSLGELNLKKRLQEMKARPQ